MTNKEKYDLFCQSTYIPIFSKSWWMDAVCGPENWDVWLYESRDDVLAAMPYYMEQRGPYHYITKPLLTQNNGLIFKEVPTRKLVTEAEFQDRVIQAACAFIKSLNLDVYEQQFHRSFQNWQPYFWNNYTNVLRYTYVIEDTSDLQKVNENISSNYRRNIRKGQRASRVVSNVPKEVFYAEHEKVFLRQGRPCPFSKELWNRLYTACLSHSAGQTFFALDEEDHVCAVLFLVWDDRAVYQLLGGYIPEFSSTQAYSALIYHGIGVAHEKGLPYDFEGSMIHQISIAFREFGGTPMPYYRIRKVFNPEIVRREAEDYIRRVQNEDALSE